MLAVLLPFAAWMLVYMLIPLASVIFYSFTNAKMAYDDFRFVGLYQFQKLFSNSTARIAIWNTVKAALIIMPISLVLSVLTAGRAECPERALPESVHLCVFPAQYHVHDGRVSCLALAVS